MIAPDLRPQMLILTAHIRGGWAAVGASRDRVEDPCPFLFLDPDHACPSRRKGTWAATREARPRRG